MEDRDETKAKIEPEPTGVSEPEPTTVSDPEINSKSLSRKSKKWVRSKSQRYNYATVRDKAITKYPVLTSHKLRLRKAKIWN